MMPEIWVLLALPLRIMMYAGISFAFGTLLFSHIFLTEDQNHKLAVNGRCAQVAGVSSICAVLFFMFQSAQLTGDTSGLVDLGLLAIIADGPAGNALGLRVFGLGLMILGLWLLPRSTWIALIGGAIAVASFLTIGHTSTADFIGIQAILFIHLAIVAFWFGALWPLYRLAALSKDAAIVADISRRFGQLASILVPVLILAGVLLAWALLGKVSLLWSTSYGLALMGKLAALAALLGLAALNKTRFVPALLNDDAIAAVHLRRAIIAEAFCFMGVFTFTALMTGAVSLPQ